MTLALRMDLGEALTTLSERQSIVFFTCPIMSRGQAAFSNSVKIAWAIQW